MNMIPRSRNRRKALPLSKNKMKAAILPKRDVRKIFQALFFGYATAPTVCSGDVYRIPNAQISAAADSLQKRRRQKNE